MRDRPTQENIELARKEYDTVSRQLSGKPQTISMYKIKEEMSKAKAKDNESQKDDTPKKQVKLSIFEIEEQKKNEAMHNSRP